MTKIATAAVIWKDNKILIAQRAKDNYWEFPGGKIDPGETPEECVVREIKEELNIDIKLGSAFETIKGHYRNQNMILYGFHSSWTDGKLKLNVHLEIKWVKVGDLNKYSFVREDREIVLQIENDKRNWKFCSRIGDKKH